MILCSLISFIFTGSTIVSVIRYQGIGIEMLELECFWDFVLKVTTMICARLLNPSCKDSIELECDLEQSELIRN